MISLILGGCRVEVGFWFAAGTAFLLLGDPAGIGIIGYLAAVIHESGHLMVMKALGVPAVCVRCGLFGLEILEEKRCRKSYWADMLIALAGPLANGVAFLLLLPVQYVTASPFAMGFLSANGIMAIFHLLPVEPLDGGQALYAGFCRRMPPARAEKICRGISFLTLLPLGILGFSVLLYSRYNFSLLLVSLYLLLLMLLKKGRYY